MSTRPMRFATQSGGAPSGQEWLDRAKRIEALGYGTLAMPDHMIGGAWAAMPALAAAAMVAPKLRVGTLVMDNDFRNPTVFARECATLDMITNGRFELGIGAGWLDRDYQSTGIPFDRGRVRVARLAEAVTLMKRLFTEEQVTLAGDYYRVEKAECRPKTVQQPHPPFLIAGGGPQILALAGREADIVAIVPAGITGSGQIPPEQFRMETMREQIDIVREAAGDRFGAIELSMFLDCTLTDDREKAIAEIAARVAPGERGAVEPETIRNNAYRGIGTLREIRDHIVRLRDAIGITYFCLRGPDVEKLGPIVSELTGR
ncbi:MAG TPA: TIGR03621 family F420-dependent LLM class oxidoreductase [Candidatus Limnocylindria bacterium]|nr:TIGR03621 family F420-dependent LLM class oxidoreductase [Candidatus Limnocylindria bacterium]